jgi:hypothetical protein
VSADTTVYVVVRTGADLAPHVGEVLGVYATLEAAGERAEHEYQRSDEGNRVYCRILHTVLRGAKP